MKGASLKEDAMMTLAELKKDRELINSIDWEMTPEMAVRLYMEWGNVWSDLDRGHIIRSKKDYSVFFLVQSWARPYYICLVKSNTEEAVDLAKIELPEKFEKKASEPQFAYAPEGELKEWLKKELNVN
jgi:hypothetical protein